MASATTENLSVRISQEMVALLDAMAKHHDRSRNYMIKEAIAQYLAVQQWQVELIAKRLKQAQSGDVALIPHDDVMKRQKKRLQEQLDL